MSFEPTSLIESRNEESQSQAESLPGARWVPILEHPCGFGPSVFFDVALNLIRNPNITSSHLFRADILYDSETDNEGNLNAGADDSAYISYDLPTPSGFEIDRKLIRQLVPRNPQLDKPIAQACYLIRSSITCGVEDSLVLFQPHVNRDDDLPWYHPAVKALAYWHTKLLKSEEEKNFNHSTVPDTDSTYMVRIFYQLFPHQAPTLDPRLLRTARNLLNVIHKHGQGRLTGYTKRVHHDQLISQKRVQDTYSDLKSKHAKRLCDAWVEKTEPSKHVFEDLGIAAFLIELWKDMYASTDSKASRSKLPSFPGFVDIGCGNGVLTEILLLSGYKGQGFDARRRKTWSILSKQAQSSLSETLFVPQPLFDLYPSELSNGSIFSRAKGLFKPPAGSLLAPPNKAWHNGLFSPGTFIISNHADELTPWTPLLAYLMDSPFLAIPCCSHNLSGNRFRAPSTYNSNMADAQAPTFFDAQKPKIKAKSVPISIPCMECDDDGTAQNPAFDITSDTTASQPSQSNDLEEKVSALAPSSPMTKPESGDLKSLSPQARAKQPSAYASLCDWVVYLSREVGYNVEREMLRIPSTRNVGLIGRHCREDFKKHGKEERRARVLNIARRERADGKAFVKRCQDLAKSDGKEHD